MSAPILVLDFDGTVCLGDDPVQFYAEEVAERLGPDLGARLLSGISAFLQGTEMVATAEDGYQATKALAGNDLSRDELRAAYRASRTRLDAGEGQTWTPPGLGNFLDELRAEGVRVVLVTNAPLLGVGTWLTTHELIDRLDAVITDAGKPTRMTGVLSGILAEHRADAQVLASVGDVWRNDIEPAISLGASGMYIDRFGFGRPATHTAGSFEALYPAIRQWAGALLTQSSPN